VNQIFLEKVQADMKRRSFIKTSVAALTGTPFITRHAAGNPSGGSIMTVNGPIDPKDAGIFLPHEHIMSTFGGEITDDPHYDAIAFNSIVRPYLEYLRGIGVGTVADCTTRYFGRDVRVLREMSEKSGINLIANTGYYGAAGDRYIPEHAYAESPGQLAERWIKEFHAGIKGSGIRPGFIKIGVDPGPLSDIDAKLVRAAAMTHVETGLVMAIHTGDSIESVKQQLEIAREEGAHPESWIWVHAQNVKNRDDLVYAAEKGAWLEFDGVSEKNAESHLALVKVMKLRGLLNRVLLSHDGNLYNPAGGPPKGFDGLSTVFIPLLERSGFTPDEVETLVKSNPQEAFTIKVRRV
jgi:predicted metal-dependent phosphotriesterase family hydrolase